MKLFSFLNSNKSSKTYVSLCPQPKQKKSGQVHSIILIVLALLCALFVFNLLGISTKLIIVLLGIIAFAIAFVDLQIALIFLIFSMLLSPELNLGAAGRRAVMIRADDIFLAVILLGWFARMAINKDLALLRGTPFNTPILLYSAVCLISTSLGAITGKLNPTVGFFFSLKYIEYFLLFFMVVNTIETKKQVKMFVFSMLVVFFLMSVYAWYQHSTGVMRASTPFEGESGEANTLGGYLVFMTMIAGGLFLNIKGIKPKIFLAISLVFALPALLFTLSRGSWIAIVPAAIALLIMTKKGKLLILAGMLCTVVFAGWIFPKEVKDRFAYTFEEQVEYNFFGRRITLDESAAARINAWIIGLKRWKRSPILGHGVGSPGPIIDNQFTRVLSETGAIGFCLFASLIFSLFRMSILLSKRYVEDSYLHGLVVGFGAGLIGLVFHSFSAATFIIIRIVEPFWFVAGIIVALPLIEATKETVDLSDQ